MQIINLISKTKFYLTRVVAGYQVPVNYTFLLNCASQTLTSLLQMNKENFIDSEI